MVFEIGKASRAGLLLLAMMSPAFGADPAAADAQAEEFFKTGKIRDALRAAMQAMEGRKREADTKPLEFAMTLTRLGVLFREVGDLQKAERVLHAAAVRWKKAAGEQDPRYARILDHLACVYDSKREFQKSETLHKRALALVASRGGEDHAWVLDNLGVLHISMGAYDKARSVLQQALDICADKKLTDSSLHSEILGNMALALEHSMAVDQAGPMLEKTLELNKRHFGSGHPRIARAANNLAIHYLRLGDLTRAEPLMIEAREIWKQSLGDRNLRYASCSGSLGELYRKKDPGKARQLIEEALKILKETVGEEHADYIQILNNYALLHDDLGEDDRAKDLLNKVIELSRRVPGIPPTDLADRLWNLALLHVELAEHAKAGPLLTEALPLMRQARGPDHPEVVKIIHVLVLIHRTLGAGDQLLTLLGDLSPAVRRSAGKYLRQDFLACYSDQLVLARSIRSWVKVELKKEFTPGPEHLAPFLRSEAWKDDLTVFEGRHPIHPGKPVIDFYRIQPGLPQIFTCSLHGSIDGSSKGLMSLPECGIAEWRTLTGEQAKNACFSRQSHIRQAMVYFKHSNAIYHIRLTPEWLQELARQGYLPDGSRFPSEDPGQGAQSESHYVTTENELMGVTCTAHGANPENPFAALLPHGYWAGPLSFKAEFQICSAQQKTVHAALEMLRIDEKLTVEQAATLDRNLVKRMTDAGYFQPIKCVPGDDISSYFFFTDKARSGIACRIHGDADGDVPGLLPRP